MTQFFLWATYPHPDFFQQSSHAGEYVPEAFVLISFYLPAPRLFNNLPLSYHAGEYVPEAFVLISFYLSASQLFQQSFYTCPFSAPQAQDLL